MPRFLFWNVDKRDLGDLLDVLCQQHAVDILVLAENGASPSQTLRAVNRQTTEYRFHPHPEQSLGDRVELYSRLPQECVLPCRAMGHYLDVRHIRPPVGESFLLAMAHLSSKLHVDADEQAQLATRLAPVIRGAEDEVGHARTIVVGDFNMNPFETGITSSESLHAVMCRNVASRGSRTVLSEERPFFYNPMWAKFRRGDDEPPGTYYRPSGVVAYFWNLFDQVLVRPSLLSVFRDDSLRILTMAGGASLLTRDGVPSRTAASDHLPIVFELDL